MAQNINRLVITGSVLKIQVSHLKSIILTSNRLNCNPSASFKTIISLAKSTINKNGLLSNLRFLEEKHRQVTHASQLVTRQSWKPDLTCNVKADKTTSLFAFTPCIGSICAPTPSPAGGTQSEPRGTFLRADWHSSAVSVAATHNRTIPRPREGRRARAPPKGMCLETLQHTPPFSLLS